MVQICQVCEADAQLILVIDASKQVILDDEDPAPMKSFSASQIKEAAVRQEGVVEHNDRLVVLSTAMLLLPATNPLTDGTPLAKWLMSKVVMPYFCL